MKKIHQSECFSFDVWMLYWPTNCPTILLGRKDISSYSVLRWAKCDQSDQRPEHWLFDAASSADSFYPWVVPSAHSHFEAHLLHAALHHKSLVLMWNDLSLTNLHYTTHYCFVLQMTCQIIDSLRSKYSEEAVVHFNVFHTQRGDTLYSLSAALVALRVWQTEWRTHCVPIVTLLRTQVLISSNQRGWWMLASSWQNMKMFLT